VPIWDPQSECMDRRDLEALQLRRLRETFLRAYTHVPHYRTACEAAGVGPEGIRTLDDLRRLPFLAKQDLRSHFPYGMLAVPMERVVRLHASSGTTGKPTVVAYTRHDLEVWADLMGCVISAAGVTSQDILQVAFGYGLFTGAFGLHQGGERVGAAVLPISSGHSRRQIQAMLDFGTTALVGTPSYALHLGEVMEDMGVDKSQLRLRWGLFGAEPWSEAMRSEIEAKLGCFATDNYGLSEVIGPGVAGECERRDGLHINEAHFIVEVIDPETLGVLPEGETGELVFTSLTKEAFPVIRYRTRDLSWITRERCPCGRSTARMARVQGRTDDMLIIRGVNVFPSQVESVLATVPGLTVNYQLVVDRPGTLDEMEVRVEVSPDFASDDVGAFRRLQEQARTALLSVLSLATHVTLLEPQTLERSAGKAQRVVDHRRSADRA
jgi:phenylacetate-CoA ligase